MKFPAIFGDGLTGMMCTGDIEYREAYLYVPYKLTLSLDTAQKIPELKEIIDKHPMFQRDKNVGGEFE